MRVRLKGINSSPSGSPMGSTVTYWYAWKGGPRLRGEPGSPEFIAAYNEAVAARWRRRPGVMFSILQGYQASRGFQRSGGAHTAGLRRQDQADREGASAIFRWQR